MFKYDLSLIIPVYNAERYIEDTISAVVNQTIFPNVEVIIVNDGSSDDTESICEKYVKDYENIKLITQNNMGGSEARNSGLRVATGNYVTFLDADDFVEADLYEKELQLIKDNSADIGVVDFKKVHDDGTIVKYRKNYVRTWNGDNSSIIKDFLSGIIGNQVVDKIFSKAIINGLSFSGKYKIGEDMLFMYQALERAEKVVMDTSIADYHYIVRSDSAMTGKFDEKYFDPVIISEIILDSCAYEKELKHYAQAHLIHEICKSCEYIYRHKAEKMCPDKLKYLRNKLAEYSVLDAKKYLIKKQFLGFLLMRFVPKIYMLAHRMMHIG